MELQNPGESPDFTFKLDRNWPSSLQRQLWEALKIESTPTYQLLNSRSDYRENLIPRISIRKPHEEEYDKDDQGQESSTVAPNEPTERPEKRHGAGTEIRMNKRARASEDESKKVSKA